MMGEEMARCHAGAMLRARPGRYYCARCVTRRLGGLRAPHPAGDLPPSSLHNFVLTMLGVHLLDRADFDALSQAAAARNRWEFMLTIAPLPIPHGTGSPVNPIAVF